VPKDVAVEVRQRVQRGFDHHEHGRLHDAMAEWETALRLDPRNVQAKRLVEFGQARAREIEAGEHPAPSRRDTLESPIPQFLAALTERKSDKVTIPTAASLGGSIAQDLIDDRETPQNDMGLVMAPHARDSDEMPTASHLDDSWAPDTAEDLPVDMEGLRNSANELMGECRSALNDNRAGAAALAAELVLQLADHAPPPGVDDMVEPSRALFERAFRAFLGNPHACPIRAIPTETISDQGLDRRAAFLMSRMDGMTSLADLIDGSGMPRFDAVRVLASLRRAKGIDLLPPL